MTPPLRPGLLAALAALGADLPAVPLARAAGAGGGAPVFSGALAPEAIGEWTEEDLPLARDGAWAERAAILEFDGGWPRATAEAIATREAALRDSDAGPEAWAAFDAELIATEAASRVPPTLDQSRGR